MWRKQRGNRRQYTWISHRHWNRVSAMALCQDLLRAHPGGNTLELRSHGLRLQVPRSQTHSNERPMATMKPLPGEIYYRDITQRYPCIVISSCEVCRILTERRLGTVQIYSSYYRIWSQKFDENLRDGPLERVEDLPHFSQFAFFQWVQIDLKNGTETVQQSAWNACKVVRSHR